MFAMSRTILSLTILVVACGCQSFGKSAINAKNQSEMLAVLKERVPLGTSIAEAQSTMQRAGFSCTLVSNGQFTEKLYGWIGGDDPSLRTVENVDYLVCKRSNSAGFLMSHLWTVALVHDNDERVSDILVRYHMDGP